MSEQVQNAEEDDADDAFQTPTYWDSFYDDEEVYDWYSAAGAMYAACRRAKLAGLPQDTRASGRTRGQPSAAHAARRQNRRIFGLGRSRSRSSNR